MAGRMGPLVEALVPTHPNPSWDLTVMDVWTG